MPLTTSNNTHNQKIQRIIDHTDELTNKLQKIKKILASTIQFSNNTTTTTNNKQNQLPAVIIQPGTNDCPRHPTDMTNQKQIPQPHNRGHNQKIRHTNYPKTKNKNKLLRKEVIQPHLPVRLPCYDFVPIADPTFDSSLQTVRPLASGVTNFHDVTGGVYKARERIHRSVADLRLLATPTSWSRVADSNPN